MKYRPKIGDGDFATKTRQVEKFLGEGHKVKVTIMFRGREAAHPELGKKILDRIVEKLEEVAKVESAPKLDGRNMIMVLGPDKKTKVKVVETPENQGNRVDSPVVETPVAEAPVATPTPTEESPKEN